MDCQTFLNLPNKADIPAPLSCTTYFISNIVSAAVPLAGVAAIILIIWSGIKFLTSGGDPLKVEGAKKTLTWAVVGLVIVLMAFVIFKIFSLVSGVNCTILGVQC